MQRGISTFRFLFIVVLVIATIAGAWQLGLNRQQRQQFEEEQARYQPGLSAIEDAADDGRRYFVLDEWGYRAPYDGKVDLTIQSIDDTTAILSSKQLLDESRAKKEECMTAETQSFIITRYDPDDYPVSGESGEEGEKTARQLYESKESKGQDQIFYAKDSTEYLGLSVDKEECSFDTYARLEGFNETEAAIKQALGQIQIIPIAERDSAE